MPALTVALYGMCIVCLAFQPVASCQGPWMNLLNMATVHTYSVLVGSPVWGQMAGDVVAAGQLAES